jgi:predicted dehydrogenase
VVRHRRRGGRGIRPPGSALILRTAFVGLGWWGRELAAAAARAGSIEVALGCSPDAADRAAFGAPCVADYAAVLGDPAIDAVVLATPHSLHVPQVIAAARAGKHVLVEKPLALDTAGALAAVAACREAGVVLAVGHNRRLLAQLGIAAHLLDDQKHGAAVTAVEVEAHFSTPESLTFAPGHWRVSRTECPGGAMTVLGIHMIDWLHVLFGPVSQVLARFDRRVVTTDMDDTAHANLVFKSGLNASLTCHYAQPYTNRLVVDCNDARLEIAADAPETPLVRPRLTWRASDGPTTIDVPYVDTLAEQMRRFAAACAGQGTPAVDGIQATRNVAVLDAIIRSAAADGAPIAVDYG